MMGTHKMDGIQYYGNMTGLQPNDAGFVDTFQMTMTTIDDETIQTLDDAQYSLIDGKGTLKFLGRRGYGTPLTSWTSG